MSNHDKNDGPSEAKVAVRGERFAGRGPGSSKPGLSPLWYVVAAYLGSILLKTIHGSTGFAGFTSTQRLAVGGMIMLTFVALVAITGAISATLRERT